MFLRYSEQMTVHLSNTPLHNFLHYIKTLYSGLSKSNFKDHYGDATKGQCLGMTAEINVFSTSGEMLWVMGQTGHQQVDCSRVVGQQQQKSDRQQWQASMSGHRGDWRSMITAGLNVSSADQRRTTAAGPTSTEVQCREKLGRQWLPI